MIMSRSLKTLKVRMEEHQKNSLAVGRWLEKHPAILSVRHPGLPSHPQHDIVLKQCYGHSGMISFYLKGELEESRKFLSALKVGVFCFFSELSMKLYKLLCNLLVSSSLNQSNNSRNKYPF